MIVSGKDSDRVILSWHSTCRQTARKHKCVILLHLLYSPLPSSVVNGCNFSHLNQLTGSPWQKHYHHHNLTAASTETDRLCGPWQTHHHHQTMTTASIKVDWLVANDKNTTTTPWQLPQHWGRLTSHPWQTHHHHYHDNCQNWDRLSSNPWQTHHHSIGYRSIPVTARPPTIKTS